MMLPGKWRITSMALWERSFLDMLEPAYIQFDERHGGEFAFGCVAGQLHCRATRNRVSFNWQGNDEMDEASGDGWAESEPDGTLSGEIRFHNGDESTFVARPWPASSTAC
ncbi:MAG TPA: hypothetical protein VHE36_12040 [Sphingomicrobium sp.]|jgi:hypothetical protein|nr:hypothetical protein [Sphingomicrobium sp.]